MTYPKVSHTDATPPASRARRRFPAIEEARAGLLGGRRHLPGERRAARRRHRRRQRVRLLRRPALRQRAAALRPPADRLRQGPHPALPDDARPAGRAPLRLGHPRPARRARGDAPARHQDHRRDPRARHREVQRRLPRVGPQVHRRVARLRHPPGALGRLRPRLQDHEPRLHGVGDVGLQAAARQGPGLRGLPRPALLLERRDAAVQPRAADGRRRLPGPPGPGRHRRLPARDAGEDDELAACSPWSGRPRRGPCRPTSRSWSARTSSTSSSRRPSRAPTPRRATSSPRRGWRRTPASSTRRASEPQVVGRYRGADLVGRTYTPPFSYYLGHERAFRLVAGRVRHHHRRHRAGAHRRRLR